MPVMDGYQMSLSIKNLIKEQKLKMVNIISHSSIELDDKEFER